MVTGIVLYLLTIHTCSFKKNKVKYKNHTNNSYSIIKNVTKKDFKKE